MPFDNYEIEPQDIMQTWYELNKGNDTIVIPADSKNPMLKSALRGAVAAGMYGDNFTKLIDKRNNNKQEMKAADKQGVYANPIAAQEPLSLYAALQDYVENSKKPIKGAIFDADETILDNGPWEYEFSTNPRIKSEGFGKIMGEYQAAKDRQATAVPGAIKAIKYLQSKGIPIHIVTGRNNTPEIVANTKSNLENLGLAPGSFELYHVGAGKDAKENFFNSKFNFIDYPDRSQLISVGDNLPYARKGRLYNGDYVEGSTFFPLYNPLYGSPNQPYFTREEIQNGLSPQVMMEFKKGLVK